MADTKGDVELDVVASIDGAVANVKVLEKETTAAAKRMEEGFGELIVSSRAWSAATSQMLANNRDGAVALGKVGQEAQGSGLGIRDLSDVLRDHRREHVQTARAVGAFTKELEGLLGAGNETAAMLGSLAGGLAVGGGFGLLIEGAKLL